MKCWCLALPIFFQKAVLALFLLNLFSPLLSFPQTVSAAYVKAGKPAPDVYLEALHRLGCSDASRVMVVEDAVHGIHAAKGAGCFAVGIPNTLPRDRLEPHADLVVDNAHELVQILLKQA